MCPQCVSLFLLIIENYDMSVRYTPLLSTTTNPKRSPYGSWAHLSYGVQSTPGDATSAETGLVLMRWRGAGDVAASQGLADGQAIAAKHRQGDAARHLASERCMGRGYAGRE